MALIYEPNIYNPLTEFLLQRAVRNFQVVGSQLFWMLRSWLHWRVSHFRFTVIMEQFVFLIGTGRQKLLSQLKMTEKLKKIATEMQDPKYKNMGVKKKGDKLKQFLKNDQTREVS